MIGSRKITTIVVIAQITLGPASYVAAEDPGYNDSAWWIVWRVNVDRARFVSTRRADSYPAELSCD